MRRSASAKRGPLQGILLQVTASTQAARFLTPLLADLAGRGIKIHELAGGLWSLEVWLPFGLWGPKTMARLHDACRRLSRYFSDPAPPSFRWSPQKEPARLPRGEKRFFRPHQVTEGLWVGPPGSKVHIAAGQRLLEIEVGRARGTGLHPATRGCLRLLQSVLDRGPPAAALDVGTGTGILALAAAISGVPSVQAIDVDSHAVGVARRNVRLNGLEGRIRVRCRDVAREGGVYPLVLAHLSSKILARRSAALIRRTAPGGWIIVGGLWRSRMPVTLRRLSPPLELVQEDQEAWWKALLLRRDPG